MHALTFLSELSLVHYMTSRATASEQAPNGEMLSIHISLPHIAKAKTGIYSGVIEFGCQLNAYILPDHKLIGH